MKSSRKKVKSSIEQTNYIKIKLIKGPMLVNFIF